MITKEYLDSLLEYDQLSGYFKWKVDRPSIIKAGDAAGWQEATGYICIRIDGVPYKAHVLAWLTMTGTYPENELDHKDKVRFNNCWENLRLANRSLNVCNAVSRPNMSGLRGVTLKDGKWRVRVQKDGVRHIIGSFATLQEAEAAAVEARKQLHGEFAYD